MDGGTWGTRSYPLRFSDQDWTWQNQSTYRWWTGHFGHSDRTWLSALNTFHWLQVSLSSTQHIIWSHSLLWLWWKGNPKSGLTVHKERRPLYFGLKKYNWMVTLNIALISQIATINILLCLIRLLTTCRDKCLHPAQLLQITRDLADLSRSLLGVPMVHDIIMAVPELESKAKINQEPQNLHNLFSMDNNSEAPIDPSKAQTHPRQKYHQHRTGTHKKRQPSRWWSLAWRPKAGIDVVDHSCWFSGKLYCLAIWIVRLWISKGVWGKGELVESDYFCGPFTSTKGVNITTRWPNPNACLVQ